MNIIESKHIYIYIYIYIWKIGHVLISAIICQWSPCKLLVQGADNVAHIFRITSWDFETCPSQEKAYDYPPYNNTPPPPQARGVGGVGWGIGVVGVLG